MRGHRVGRGVIALKYVTWAMYDLLLSKKIACLSDSLPLTPTAPPETPKTRVGKEVRVFHSLSLSSLK